MLVSTSCFYLGFHVFRCYFVAFANGSVATQFSKLHNWICRTITVLESARKGFHGNWCAPLSVVDAIHSLQLKSEVTWARILTDERKHSLSVNSLFNCYNDSFMQFPSIFLINYFLITIFCVWLLLITHFTINCLILKRYYKIIAVQYANWSLIA